jgi:hypothetical protein
MFPVQVEERPLQQAVQPLLACAVQHDGMIKTQKNLSI